MNFMLISFSVGCVGGIIFCCGFIVGRIVESFYQEDKQNEY